MMFGAKKQTIANEEQRVGALRIQSSAYGLCIPLVWGTNRVSGNLIWYGDFQATAHTTKEEVGGKGGGGGTVTTNTTYTYATALAMGLCEGPVESIGAVWSAKSRTTMSELGFSVLLGSHSQSPWTYLTSKHPAEALVYPGTCYVANGSFSLGGSPNLPNLSFEVRGPRIVGLGGIKDASPAGIITDFLTDPTYGAGFPSARLADISDYSDYCWANGLFISPALTEQAEAHEHLAGIADITNSAIVWSEGKLKFRPFGDTEATANGVTWSASITPVADLTDDDFLPISEREVIIVRRSDQADAYNHIQIEYRDRALDYNLAIASAKDDAAIAQYGLRSAEVRKYHAICERTVADTIAHIKQQREYVRREFEFRLGWRWCFLEPMDIVTVTHVSGALDLQLEQVRIVSIEEDEGGKLTLVAEEFPFGVATPAQVQTQEPGGYSVDLNVAPGNAAVPVMFEPPISLAGRPEVWLATSGGETWGGCEIWVSLDDATYTKVGTLAGGARHGVLTAALPAATDPDAANVLSVDLTTSRGVLTGGTSEDRDLYNTLCYVGGELVSFASAALTAAYGYDLSNMRRGAYGSPIDAHAIGAPFVRLDQAVFKYAYEPSILGKTLYIKLRSFNSYGGARQELDSLTAYTFTTAGAPVGGVGGVYAEQPFTGRSAKVGWPAMAGAIGYRVEVWAVSVKRRTIDTTDNRYEYTFEDARADGGPWRTVQFRVYGLTETGISDTPALLQLTNTQIGAPTGVTYGNLIEGFSVSCNTPTDTDYAGCRVWVSDTSGFDPTAIAPVYDGPDTLYTAYDLTANADYYVRIGLYDVFGTDGMTLSSELHVIPRGFATNPADTLAAINALLSGASDDDRLIMSAGRFAIRDPDDANMYPFAVVDDGGTWRILLNGDVLIGGSVDIANLRTGALPSDVIMRLGGGTIELDGMGEIRVYAATGPDQDFVRLTSGQINFLRYISGTGYVTYNYLSRIESGVSNNGDTVVIPGYWKSQPKIQVSPLSLALYKASAAAQDQALDCYAGSLAETSPGSGRWQFVATATLNIAAGSGTSAVGSSSGLLTGASTWSSATRTTPGNCVSVTPSVVLTSIRWTGSGVSYAARQVRWRVRYTGDAGGGTWRTTSMGAQLLSVIDSDTFTFPSAGTYTFWIEFVAEDAGGAFNATGVEYDTSTDFRTGTDSGTSGGNGFVSNNYTFWISATLPAYSPPSGWSIASTTYSFGFFLSCARNGCNYIDTFAPNGANIRRSSSDESYSGSYAYTTTGYSTSGAAIRAIGVKSGAATNYTYYGGVTTARADFTLRRPKGAGATGNNTFVFDAYGYALSSASVLASGTLNWLAIGE
jgi:hypothetical protein